MFWLKRINRCDVFILLNILYSMQGLLYPQGVINQLLQMVIILWSLTIAVKYLFLRKHNSRLLKATSWLVFMYVIYGTILLFWGDSYIPYAGEFPSKYIYLQVSLRSLLPIYVFYHYSYRGFLSSQRIRIYGLFLLASLMPMFYFRQMQNLLYVNKNEVTNNMGYDFLSLLPLCCFFYKRPIIQYILLSITLLFIVMAMKRGAIVIAGFCVVLLIYGNIFSKGYKYKVINILYSVLIIIGAVYFISHMIATSDYFALRFENTLSGDTSGRDDIFEAIWNSVQNETNLFYFLLGRGADSTWGIAGVYAHNDWLETVCNNGLLGVFILLNFYYTIVKDAHYLRITTVKFIYTSYIILFLILLLKTFFSMSIQNMDISQSLLLGYFAFLISKTKNNIFQERFV